MHFSTEIPLLLFKIKSQNKRRHSRLIRLIGVVFSNGAMLSVSDKSDSVNKYSQEISKLNEIAHSTGVAKCP